MSKIAVLGSSVDNFLKSHYKLEEIQKIIQEGINLRVSRKDILLSTGEAGAPNMALNFVDCRKRIYVPKDPFSFCEGWTREEQFRFAYQLGAADLVTVTGGHIIKMLEDADSVLSFWVGERTGRAFDQMTTALDLGKEIQHGLSDMVITRDILFAGWNPNDQQGR